ncbi:MAG: hypothetical protein AABY32_04180 [Nanoarchaeota archaeon]
MSEKPYDEPLGPMHGPRLTKAYELRDQRMEELYALKNPTNRQNKAALEKCRLAYQEILDAIRAEKAETMREIYGDKPKTIWKIKNENKYKI